jgi:hypothetical protein
MLAPRAINPADDPAERLRRGRPFHFCHHGRSSLPSEFPVSPSIPPIVRGASVRIRWWWRVGVVTSIINPLRFPDNVIISGIIPGLVKIIARNAPRRHGGLQTGDNV